MSIRNFLTSKIFFRHFALAVGITSFAVFLILNSLKLYTRHGESIPVPDLKGLTEYEFSRILDQQHLKYIITDSTYVEEMVAGGVVDQVPDAGLRVKRNRKLFLTINAIAPEQIAIPPLTDISLRQSLAQIESAGLIPGDITYKPSEFRNLVLQATIGGREVVTGEMVAKGTRVDLVVGSGEEMELVFLPNVTGLTLQDARQIIAHSILSLGAVIYDNTIFSRTDSMLARVWRQHPDYRSVLNVHAGTSIDLWVTTDESKFIENNPENKETEEDLDF